MSKTPDGTQDLKASYAPGGTNTEELLDNLFKDFLEDYPQFASEMEQIKQSIPPILDEQTRLARIDELDKLPTYPKVYNPDCLSCGQRDKYRAERLSALEKPNRERST